MASVTIRGLDSLLSKLDPRKVEGASADAVETLAARADNKLAENMQTRVYGRPTSPNYQRTGAARRGRSNVRQGRTERKITYSSKKGGASRNYSPYLNRNSRIKKNNTRFWDDGVKWTKKESKNVLKESIRKVWK